MRWPYILRFPQGLLTQREWHRQEHLLLMLISTYSRLLLDIRTFGFVSVYIWSQNMC